MFNKNNVKIQKTIPRLIKEYLDRSNSIFDLVNNEGIRIWDKINKCYVGRMYPKLFATEWVLETPHKEVVNYFNEVFREMDLNFIIYWTL